MSLIRVAYLNSRRMALKMSYKHVGKVETASPVLTQADLNDIDILRHRVDATAANYLSENQLPEKAIAARLRNEELRDRCYL